MILNVRICLSCPFVASLCITDRPVKKKERCDNSSVLFFSVSDEEEDSFCWINCQERQRHQQNLYIPFFTKKRGRMTFLSLIFNPFITETNNRIDAVYVLMFSAFVSFILMNLFFASLFAIPVSQKQWEIDASTVISGTEKDSQENSLLSLRFRSLLFCKPDNG